MSNGYYFNPLSANTLFHFTHSIDSLIGILQIGFKPKYCLEDFSNFNTGELAIPMTCFCDIPLSQIRNHASMYGKYAIGLSKEWGKNHGISPVMYTYNNSESANMLRENLMIFHRGDYKDVHKYLIEGSLNTIRNNPTALLVETISRLSAFLAYVKPYEGKFWREGSYLKEPVKFYDEREWRYVPKFEDTILHNVKNHLDKETFQNTDSLLVENQKLQSNFKLDFIPNDIRYIVVNKEQEVLPMVDSISKIKSKYSSAERELAKTRVISMDQIMEDF